MSNLYILSIVKHVRTICIIFFFFDCSCHRYTGSAPTTKSIWGVEGGPGFSTLSFIPIINYFLTMDSTLTGYLIDNRGTGLSSPLNCSFVPPVFDQYNQTSMNLTNICNRQVIKHFSWRLQYYNTYNSALDMLRVIKMVNPKTVSIYSTSYGTYFMNTYLQLPGSRYDAVVFDGPIPPQTWPAEYNAMTNSLVAQDQMNLCVRLSSKCKQYLGEMGHIPRMVRQQITEGVLPCLQKLPWLNTPKGNYLIGIFNQALSGGYYNRPLGGPLFYRLYRCSSSDVDQLNFFYNYWMSTHSSQGEPTDSLSILLATNIGVSELQSFQQKPLSYNQIVANDQTSFATGSGGELTISFARDISKWPSYPRPKYTTTFANPNAPVLVACGTLDSNIGFGSAQWTKNGLGSSATLLAVPYYGHGLLNYDTLSINCIDVIMSNWLSNFGKNVNMSCVSSIPAPDFEGVTSSAGDLSQTWFGTRDLWNEGSGGTKHPTMAPISSPYPTASVRQVVTYSVSQVCAFHRVEIFPPIFLLAHTFFHSISLATFLSLSSLHSFFLDLSL